MGEVAGRFSGGNLNMRLRFGTRRTGKVSVVEDGLSVRARLACGLCAAALAGLLLAACGETITKHGHHFQENDLQQISSGMSQDQVRSTLGTPTTTATVGSGTAFYYISSTTGQTSFFKPVEKDRKVLAVYFSPLGSVDRVAHYGLKDGKVFNYAKAQTPSPARDESILKALFRNLGTKQLGLDY
jgi:outer membrane protein assembly factor BamE (lipoprotein component of BamABCDE complex)